MNATLLKTIPVKVTRRFGPSFRRELNAHGICHLIFDQPGSSANLFTRESLRELENHLTAIAAAGEVKGLVIRSGKPRIFIAGADLHAMLHATREDVEELVVLGQRVFNTLASLRIPTVAAIHGACLGGGCELALACDFRIASDDKATRIGLPETQLGLIPAWGGCTRLPRLIGIKKACEAIVKGTAFSASHARKKGIIDEVVPAHCLIDSAIAWLMNPSQRKRRVHWMDLLSPLLRAAALRQIQAVTRGNFHAPPAAVQVVTRAPHRSIDSSLAAERAQFRLLMDEPGTRNLIRLFLGRESLKKRTVTGQARPVERVAVIGAGIMGSGIAYWLSTKKIHVLLTDINANALALAAQRLDKSFRAARERRLLTASESQAARDRITLATSGVALSQVDLVIEAAVENAEIKRRLFADILTRVKDDAVVASNTSAIPLSSLGGSSRLVGLHFFNPVHAMPLVEVVRPDGADEDSIATAVKFVQDMGKIPLVVRDRPGFLVNRILMPYLIEAARLVEEGASIVSVDAAMLDFGMPMGPLRLLDEVGLDVALHVVKTLADFLPEKLSVPSWLEERVRFGKLGVKSGTGYYVYQKDRQPRPADALIQTRADYVEASLRLPLLLTNEAAHCLDEGIVESATDVDLGMVLGTGYAPFRGGPLREADARGLGKTLQELQLLESLHGALYRPARGLINRAAENAQYHPEVQHHEIH